LDHALAGGGSVTFDCGTAPVTITVTTPILIPAGSGVPATSIDGGGLVTISSDLCTVGNGTFWCPLLPVVFINSPRAHLVLRNVTFNSRFMTIFNRGKVSVTNCVFSGAYAMGAIRNNGTLSVTDSTFTGNTNTYMGGGAILNYGDRNSPGGIGVGRGKLSVTNSTFFGNSADAGGAILNMKGKVSVSNSTFTGNNADDLERADLPTYGGAIQNTHGGSITVANSTFSGNRAHSVGGAIGNSHLGPGGGRLTVTNSTFYDNACTSPDCIGGAISNAGRLTVTSCTFSNNSASNREGGAIAQVSGRATITNSVVANSLGGVNCFSPVGSLKDGGHNLDDGATCGFTAAGSLSNTDPQLDPAGLADNGGPTQTIAVQAGSPAISGGDATVCKSRAIKSLDQRGYVRPGTGSVNCTIGAYEFNSPGPPATLAP
jgi:predicted outer membrane repeat protein